MKQIYIFALLLLFSCEQSTAELSKSELDLQTLEKAETALKDNDYNDAISFFNELIENESNDIKSISYAGLSYALMGVENLDEAYLNFKTGYEIESDSAKNELLSGLCFLEFSFKANYSESIRYAETLLTNSPDFSMRFNPNINHQDIKLTKAQSYFSMKEYSKCLVEVQALGKLQATQNSDELLVEKLLEALKQLQ